MSGCSWQNKSFTVVVHETKKDVKCVKCGVDCDGDRKLNGDYVCRLCFSNHSGKGFTLDGVFYTHKDLTYNFVTEMFNGKPMEFRTKGQFKKMLKSYHIADASLQECNKEVSIKKRWRAEKDKIMRRKDSEKIYVKLKEKGAFKRKWN